MVFSSDGATISPLTELWTSADEGMTWVRMRPTREPRFETGLAFAPDGTLIIIDDRHPHSQLWRTTPDGFMTSTDGRTWHWVPFPPATTG